LSVLPVNDTSSAALFDDFILAGFECSDHRLEDGTRLDLLDRTRHRELAAEDYSRLRAAGIRTCREGASWVRCEPAPGEYDFTSLESRIEAAGRDLLVIWDLLHFGWPDHVDVFRSDFSTRFAAYAARLAEWLSARSPSPKPPMFCPVNEISFLAWAGGDLGFMNPFCTARGVELKMQLVSATIAAIDAIRRVAPHARFLHSEPAIHIVPAPEHPKTWRRVECDNALQYQALDMLGGRVFPALGGSPDHLDIIGLNYYSDNQFMLDGTTISRGDPRYKPLRQILAEVTERYRRPLLISETGAEGDERAPWIRYVAGECVAAMRAGCNLQGLTLYPVLNHPGWVDQRHCHNGLWDYADASGERVIYRPLASALEELVPKLRSARLRTLQRGIAATRSEAKWLEHA
jgi:hypothetical protein